MKALKLAGISLLVYAGIVVAFEGIFIGVVGGIFGFQPTAIS